MSTGTAVSAIIPQIPAPGLAAEKFDLLHRLVAGLPPAELHWLAAWIAAQAGSAKVNLASGGLHQEQAATAQLTIIYGSQTGNAKRIAEDMAERGSHAGIPLRLLRADTYPLRELANERYLILVISTQGEAEPPDDARGLVEFLTGRRVPKLPNLHFAVLGLGDSSYPQFCAIGRQIDIRLTELGAIRMDKLGEADVEPEEVAKPWVEQVLSKAAEALRCAAPTPTLRLMPSPTPNQAPIWTRRQPFTASVLANQRIVARDSEREVRHIELSLQGSGLHYRPGDALGVCPVNPPALVEQWLETLGLDGAQMVTVGGRTLQLEQWLSRERDITKTYRSWVEAHAGRGRHQTLNCLLQSDQRDAFAQILEHDQPIDLLRRYPVEWPAEQLVAALHPLQPRMYSIASSQHEVGEEVHLTVAVVDYIRYGKRHWGAASSFLAAASDNIPVAIFIEPNERFRLPSDPSRDLIMIGPGTGVAPFRGFLQERQQTGASGRNWLIFGNRHFREDFLYQAEWQAALQRGVLQRLDLAFSRDTCERIHVQQRLREQGRELYAWLRDGACLYVCGNAKRMAADVHNALIEIVATHGAQPLDEARAWLSDLMRQGRYARDIY